MTISFGSKTIGRQENDLRPGAPFYVVSEQKFRGQDRLACLDWYLGQGGSRWTQ